MAKIYPFDKLLSAATASARAHDNKSLAFVLQHLVSSPESATNIKKFLQSKDPEPVKSLSADEALAFLVSADLTRDSYQKTRNIAIQRHANLFPSYRKVLAAKKNCYPKNVIYEEAKAEVPLQDLLDHAVQRLVLNDKVQNGINNVKDLFEPKLILNGKWGFDGATGQSKYKQRINNEQDTDASLFCTTFIPIDLSFENVVSADSKEALMSVWTNPQPSSTSLCMPLRIQYKKENFDVLREEKEYYDQQINELKDTQIQFVNDLGETVQLTVSYCLKLTMIDGKAANAICNNKASVSCNICGCTPKQMNTAITNDKLEIDENSLGLGLSTLHAWIRCFEFILHIAYRLDFKEWRMAKKEHKQLGLAQKHRIQEEFRQKLGLLVDIPKDGGSGTTNDGNTARKAFKNFRQFSAITKVDENLIRRLYTILCVVNSYHQINNEAFESYCIATFEIYVDKYDWFYMPASVHKLLVHSVQVIEKFLLPIGMYSEEAQECRHKHNSHYRLHHSRKMSRIYTMTDHFNFLLTSSDPVISLLNFSTRTRKKDKLSAEAISLLEMGQVFRDSQATNDSQEMDIVSDSLNSMEMYDEIAEFDDTDPVIIDPNDQIELPDYYDDKDNNDC